MLIKELKCKFAVQGADSLKQRLAVNLQRQWILKASFVLKYMEKKGKYRDVTNADHLWDVYYINAVGGLLIT